QRPTAHRAPAPQMAGRDARMGPGCGVQIGGWCLQDLVTAHPTEVQPTSSLDKLMSDLGGASMVPDGDVRLVGSGTAVADIRIHQGQLSHVEHEVLDAAELASGVLRPPRVVMASLGRDQSHRDNLAVSAGSQKADRGGVQAT